MFTGRITSHLGPALPLQKAFDFAGLLKATTCKGSQCRNPLTCEKCTHAYIWKWKKKPLKSCTQWDALHSFCSEEVHYILMVTVKSLRTQTGWWPVPQEWWKSHIIIKKHEEGSKLAGINYSWITRVAQCPCGHPGSQFFAFKLSSHRGPRDDCQVPA